ncbi:sigX [Symbiodinium necroappetens]|uniref:SigX protein n=1 Tax=Symbiodinium necroappetens TaxID=1628268 RepID=A0A812TZ50_9DINO|nr:sigX [Symbiodinium necroappetens]
MNRAALVIVSGAVLGLGGLYGCQSSGVSSEEGWGFVSFEEQAAFGGSVYGANCAECHGNAGQGTMEAPRLVGEGALPLRQGRGSARTGEFRTAMDVAAFVTANMPPNEEDRAEIGAREYWAVLAFALRANGVSLDEPVMTSVTAQLEWGACCPWADPPTDEQVVARVLGGDAGAFELLMRRHNRRLYRVARAVLRSDADAEDALQEAYLRAYASLGTFEGRASVATWLSRIVYHEALRRGKKERAVRTTIRTFGERTAGGGDGGGGGDDAGRGVALRESANAAVRAIDALPESMRVVAVLRLVQELSTRETALSLGMTELGVRVTLHRARRRLAKALDAEGGSGFAEAMPFDGARCDRVVAGVMGRTIVAIEKGKYSPSQELAFRISEVFRVSIEGIFWEEAWVKGEWVRMEWGK